MLINKSVSMLGFTMLLILSTVIVNFAAAQQPPKTIGIKITSPERGQQISVTDNDLKISGIASHDGSLSCNVYVIVNEIKPYQKVLPTGGHSNTNDSTWIYNLVPSYTTIKTGTNKITSKLACQEKNNVNTSNTSLTTFYSINVTGIASTTKQQEQSLKNSSNSNVSNNNKKQTSIEKKNVPISNDAIKTLGSTTTNSQKQLNSNMKKTNAAKTNRIPLKGANNNNANVTGRTEKRLQVINQPSQINPATLLSTAGILSTHQADRHADRTTNANIDQSHSKGTNSKSSLGPTLSTSNTGDNNLNNNGSAEPEKQQSNTSAVDKSEYTSFGSKHSNNNVRSLSVSMHLAKGPIHVGNKENMTLGVTDSNSTHVIAGAAILGKITNPSGWTKKLEGTTDGKGKVSYSWQASGDDTSGKYKVVMEASAPGYENNSVSKTFTVLPVPIISSKNGASSDLRNINNNSPNAKEVTSLPVAASPPSTNNNRSPLIFSKQNSTPTRLALQSIHELGRVYIPTTTNLITNSFNSYENGRVYIPSLGHNNNIMPTFHNNNIMPNKVNIPNPETNSTRKLVKQDISPIQKPRLPNNNEVPFVMATPLLHITNGTSLPASDQLPSITIALNLVDRMRVIGFDSDMLGSPSKLSVSSASTSIPQKSTVFIPTIK
ncbi:MAG: hypothetical protein WAM14_25235 [Candidatus Nitrosopolaris sp.]